MDQGELSDSTNISIQRERDNSLILLFVTFTLLQSIAILDKGSFVRPTDEINMSMVKAMARKTVLEGPTSMQQAAYNRSIIQCSGSFATSSKNGKVIKVWDMTVLDNKTATTAEEGDDSSVTNVMMKNNVAKVCLVQELQHDAAIEVIKATE